MIQEKSSEKENEIVNRIALNEEHKKINNREREELIARRWISVEIFGYYFSSGYKIIVKGERKQQEEEK